MTSCLEKNHRNFPMISNAISSTGLNREFYMMAANVGQHQLEMVRNLRIKKLTIKKKHIFTHSFFLDI